MKGDREMENNETVKLKEENKDNEAKERIIDCIIPYLPYVASALLLLSGIKIGIDIGENKAKSNIDGMLRGVAVYYPDAKIIDIWNPEVYKKWMNTLATGIRE